MAPYQPLSSLTDLAKNYKAPVMASSSMGNQATYPGATSTTTNTTLKPAQTLSTIAKTTGPILTPIPTGNHVGQISNNPAYGPAGQVITREGLQNVINQNDPKKAYSDAFQADLGGKSSTSASLANYLYNKDTQPPSAATQTPDQVKALQDSLVKDGYMTQGEVNTGYGTYGPKTTAAVALKSSGKPGPYANGGSNPQDTGSKQDTPINGGALTPEQIIALEEAAKKQNEAPKVETPAPETGGGIDRAKYLQELTNIGASYDTEIAQKRKELVDISNKQAEQNYGLLSHGGEGSIGFGRAGLLQGLAAQQQAIKQKELDQLMAAKKEQTGILESKLGITAPAQAAPTTSGYNPITGERVYGLGTGTGGNTLNLATNLQTNADKSSSYAQQSTSIANDTQLLQSLGSQAIESAKAINPNAFTAGNTIGQLLQNQTNPGALAVFKNQINAVQDQISKILSDPQTSPADATNLKSILVSLTNGTLNANQLQTVINSVTKIGNTLSQSYSGLANKYAQGGTNLVTGTETPIKNTNNPASSTIVGNLVQDANGMWVVKK